MSYKYLGEAIALLGIAWSIMRWIRRNAAEVDAGPHARMDILVGRSGRGSRPHAAEPRGPAMEPGGDVLAAAAAAFGIAPDVLARMDARERALLVSGWEATRAGRTEGGPAGED